MGWTGLDDVIAPDSTDVPRWVPPAYVKRQKNDMADAAAIA
jgi:hypothetical protein